MGSDEVETKKFYFQDEINRFYTGQKPKLWYLYSWFFTNYLIYSLYACGMPIMYIIGCLYFTICYWVGKFSFLTWNKSGQDQSEPKLAEYSVSLMKWGVVLHLFMTLFFLSNNRLLSPDDFTPELHYRTNYEPLGSFLSRRFSSDNSKQVAMAVIVILALYILATLVVKVFFCFKFLRENSKERIQEHELLTEKQLAKS